MQKIILKISVELKKKTEMKNMYYLKSVKIDKVDLALFLNLAILL